MIQTTLFERGLHLIPASRVCPSCKGPMQRPERGGASVDWWHCRNCSKVVENFNPWFFRRGEGF